MRAAISHSNAAHSDLVDIWLHIAQDDPLAADRQIDRLDQAVQRLQDFPDIGHQRGDAGHGVRLLLQDSYLIIYRHLAAEGRVIIERIIHGRRNLADLLG